MGAGNGGVGVAKRPDPDVTPRHSRPQPAAPSYKNLVDAPSPSGRLGDRIVRLKQRCILALGKKAFDEAYNYLRQYASTDDVCHLPFFPSCFADLPLSLSHTTHY
jgi:hypothetical protein